MIEIEELLDLSHSIAAPLFAGKTYPWEALEGIKDFILALGPTLDPEEFDHPAEGVWIAKDATVFPSAYIGSHVLRVMGLSCIVVATSTPICSMLQGVGRISTPLILTATAMIIKIATNYLFVSNVNLNITGAAVGSLVAFTYVCVVGMYILIRRAKVMPNLVNCMLKPLISAALCALTAYFSYRLINHFVGSTISTILAVFCAAIVYFFTLVILRTFTETELMMLPKGKNLVTILAKLHLLG